MIVALGILFLIGAAAASGYGAARVLQGDIGPLRALQAQEAARVRAFELTLCAVQQALRRSSTRTYAP